MLQRRFELLATVLMTVALFDQFWKFPLDASKSDQDESKRVQTGYNLSVFVFYAAGAYTIEGIRA